MNLFDNILPTFLNKAGQWIDGVLNTPLVQPAPKSQGLVGGLVGKAIKKVKSFLTPIKPQATTPTSGSTPQFVSGQDIIGATIKAGINLQQKFTDEMRNQQVAILTKYGMPEEEAKKFPVFDPTGGIAGLEEVGVKIAPKIATMTKSSEIVNVLKKEFPWVEEKIIAPLATKLSSITDVNVVKTEIQKAVGEVAEKVISKIPAIERGFIISAKEAVPEAEKIAGQYVPRSTDALSIKAQNLIKEDISTAENLALRGTDDNAVATASELLKYYRNEAETATNVAIKNALYDKAAEVANTIAPKLTEQGRSIQAASILGRLTPEGQVRFAASEIARYNDAVSLAKKVPELTGEQTKHILDEMKAINDMAEGTEKAMKFQKLQNYVGDLVPTALYKKIISVWKAGLLTGVKTSGLNIFANVSHAVTETAKDIPATIVDKVVSLFSGKRTVAFNVEGLPTGAKEGLAKGWRYLTTGFDERNIGTKLDYTKINFGTGKLAKGLQAYTDAVFRSMGSEDQPFYYAAKLRSLYEQAKVGAINKGLKGIEAQKFIDNLIQNPTDEMIKYASFDAETAVFQNKTWLGGAARAIQKIPGGEVVVPFGRTPSAVATQIFKYSPAGFGKPIIRLFELAKNGEFDQRLFSQEVGRALTGTGVMALGALLMKKGVLTLARPTSEREQKLWELEGRQANSIKIGDKWRQIQILGPVGNVLLIGGYFQRAFNDSGSATAAMVETLGGAAQSFTQQTFLTGVSNFIDAISDPARSAKYVAGSTLASSIPTIISDIARATDSKERRATDDKFINEIINKFEARIPGVRESLEPQVTVLGQEKETIGNPLEIMADPTRPSPTQSTPVIQELRRLWDAGFKVSPTLLGDKNGYFSLTPEQNTDLWKRAGKITNEKLLVLFQHPEYQKLADDQKAKMVDDFVSKSKLVARVEKVLQLTEGLTGQPLLDKLKELKDSGLMTREVFNAFQKLR